MGTSRAYRAASAAAVLSWTVCLCGMFVPAVPAPGGVITISASANQSGQAYEQDGVRRFFALTGGVGYDFTGQPRLSAVDYLTITLTIADGDSMMPGFDYGDLTLDLDGAATQLYLDGFGDGTTDTRTFVREIGDPLDNYILHWLSQDNRLNGIVHDLDMDGPPFDMIAFPSGYTTTLSLTGPELPEPASPALLAAAGVAAALTRRARRAPGRE